MQGVSTGPSPAELAGVLLASQNVPHGAQASLGPSACLFPTLDPELLQGQHPPP